MMNLQLKRKLFLLVFGLAVVTLTTSLIFVKQKASSNATSSETNFASRKRTDRHHLRLLRLKH